MLLIRSRPQRGPTDRHSLCSTLKNRECCSALENDGVFLGALGNRLYPVVPNLFRQQIRNLPRIQCLTADAAEARIPGGRTWQRRQQMSYQVPHGTCQTSQTSHRVFMVKHQLLGYQNPTTESCQLNHGSCPTRWLQNPKSRTTNRGLLDGKGQLSSLKKLLVDSQ